MNVSIVIPLYNKASRVGKALDSVLTQTYNDFEVVVVDDGSTDDGASVVRSYSDRRIRLIGQANSGASAARNAGIKACAGRWVAFLDADDEWFPTKLAQQMRDLAKHPEVEWAACGFRRLSGGRVVHGAEHFEAEWFDDEAVIKDALVPLANGRHIWTGTVVIRSDIMQAMGGFDTSLRSAEDLDLWVRIAVRSPRLVYISEPLAAYHAGTPGSLTATAAKVMDRSSVTFALRAAEMAGKLPEGRKAHLLAFARSVVFINVNAALRTGANRLAREMLREASPLDIGLRGRWLELRSYLVPGVLYTKCLKAGRTVRRIIQRPQRITMRQQSE